jgi:hypothetical protein
MEGWIAVLAIVFLMQDELQGGGGHSLALQFHVLEVSG